MGSPVASFNFQGATDKAQQAAGSFGGKLIGSIAGILLLVTVLKSTFYVVKVGERGVLMRGGLPVLKHNGRLFYLLGDTCAVLRLYRLTTWFIRAGDWRKRKQVGLYKVKRPGIRMKFPGWYDVEKVNIQKRIQKLPEFTVDCPDGQRMFNIDLVTRVPCDDDGPEFADYPAKKIINSSEADDVFESYCGMALVSAFELAQETERSNQVWLLNHVNREAGMDIDRVGYVLERISQRSRSFTSIQVAVNNFKPEQPPGIQSGSADLAQEEKGTILSLPHPLVTATALGEELSSS